MSQASAHEDKIIRSGMLIVNGDGDETYLYRVYDVFDDLIYIGITYDLSGRLASHRRGARWWTAAFRIEFDVYPTRALALRVEAQSIARLKPPENLTNLGGAA